MSHNGIPTISSVPGFKNAWVATGHSMLGISMGTGTGKLLSELISGESPHIDPTPYQL
jgi:D-amino-acid dehydrogenase